MAVTHVKKVGTQLCAHMTVWHSLYVLQQSTNVWEPGAVAGLLGGRLSNILAAQQFGDLLLTCCLFYFIMCKIFSAS